MLNKLKIRERMLPNSLRDDGFQGQFNYIPTDVVG